MNKARTTVISVQLKMLGTRNEPHGIRRTCATRDLTQTLFEVVLRESHCDPNCFSIVLKRE